MLKRSKFFIAILLIMMLALTACGKTDNGDTNGDGDKPRAVLLIGNKGDLSFNDSAVRGVEQAEKELDIDVTILEYGTQPDNFEPTIVDAAEEGYDVILTTSEMTDYIREYASDYPDITWVIFDNTFDFGDGGYENVYTIQYKANEGSFLGGYVAAKVSETGVLGFLGGVENPIIKDFVVGYEHGARTANPDVKVLQSYTGGWTDAAKGKELSLAMNQQGADVIFACSGGAGVGTFEAAVEKDFLAIGVDTDQALVYEDAGRVDFAEIILTSVLKNVDNSLYRALDLYLKGDLPVGTTEVLGLKELATGIAENKYFDGFVSDEIKAEVEELAEKINNGEIVVESSYD